MGGADRTDPLQIISVRLLSTSVNLERLIGPLTILDGILSDEVSEDNEILYRSYRDDNDDVKILSHLFAAALGKKVNLPTWSR